MTTNKATVERFESFSDGSGAEGIVNAFGFRFGFCFGSKLVVNPLNRGNRFGNRSVAMYQGALRIAEAEFTARVNNLGADWLAKNKEMYQ